MLIIIVLFSLFCGKPYHPHIIVEENVNILSYGEFSGVNYYIPKWYPTSQEKIEYRGYGWKLATVYHYNQSTFLSDMLFRSDMDMIILDEPNPTIDFSSVISAVKKINPTIQIGVVEPFYSELEEFLLINKVDFIGGEDYGGVSVGNIEITELNNLAKHYDIKSQMWTVGTSQVMWYENLVDKVIAVDIHGTWGTSRDTDYSNQLLSRLKMNCMLYLPSVVK